MSAKKETHFHYRTTLHLITYSSNSSIIRLGEITKNGGTSVARARENVRWSSTMINSHGLEKVNESLTAGFAERNSCVLKRQQFGRPATNSWDWKVYFVVDLISGRCLLIARPTFPPDSGVSLISLVSAPLFRFPIRCRTRETRARFHGKTWTRDCT